MVSPLSEPVMWDIRPHRRQVNIYVCVNTDRTSFMNNDNQYNMNDIIRIAIYGRGACG